MTPQCRPEDIAADIRNLGFMGLKPYRIYSVTGDTHRCRIHEFLTHPQMEVANELGLWVTMHLSRWHGCADAENLRDLEEYTTRRYPKIKWILRIGIANRHFKRRFPHAGTVFPVLRAVKLGQVHPPWREIRPRSDDANAASSRIGVHPPPSRNGGLNTPVGSVAEPSLCSQVRPCGRAKAPAPVRVAAPARLSPGA